jgi:hypothetical protein
MGVGKFEILKMGVEEFEVRSKWRRPHNDQSLER